MFLLSWICSYFHGCVLTLMGMILFSWICSYFHQYDLTFMGMILLSWIFSLFHGDVLRVASSFQRTYPNGSLEVA